jgi:hypothetical protein
MLLAGALTFLFTLAVFLLSHVHQVADSAYSMLVSESLIHRHTFTLDRYSLPRPDYRLEESQGHVYYFLPAGTSLLSVPYVAVMNAIGISAAKADGTYDPRGEVMIETSLAALLMAGLAVVFLITARLLLPLSWSIAITLGGVLGTQIYSTASRALWSDTWGSLILGVVVLLLLVHETGRRSLRPSVLATLLSIAYVVRPTYAVPIVAITIYLGLFHRRLVPTYILTGAAWLVLFVAYSWSHFHAILPGYYRLSRLHTDTFWVALAGNLVSPSRGVLVYVPTLFVVGFLCVRYFKLMRYKRLFWLSLAVVVAHLIAISSFPHWWGGHSFGPRLTTGLVPWFFLLAILGVDAMLRTEARAARPSIVTKYLKRAVASCVLILSLFIHTVGATQHATWLWNIRPLPIDEHPERLWDWRQPQFLAKYLPYAPPRRYPVLRARMDFSGPDSDEFLWFGWTREGEQLWADSDSALIFATPSQPNMTLVVTLKAFVVPGKLDKQDVSVLLNDKPLTAFSVNDSELHQYSLALPSGWLLPQNILRFRMSNATSEQKLAIGNDPRFRSFRLLSLEVARVNEPQVSQSP